jgi:hypothetical protein
MAFLYAPNSGASTRQISSFLVVFYKINKTYCFILKEALKYNRLWKNQLLF